MGAGGRLGAINPMEHCSTFVPSGGGAGLIGFGVY
jgi:hypothetical protein